MGVCVSDESKNERIQLEIIESHTNDYNKKDDKFQSISSEMYPIMTPTRTDVSLDITNTDTENTLHLNPITNKRLLFVSIHQLCNQISQGCIIPDDVLNTCIICSTIPKAMFYNSYHLSMDEDSLYRSFLEYIVTKDKKNDVIWLNKTSYKSNSWNNIEQSLKKINININININFWQNNFKRRDNKQNWYDDGWHFTDAGLEEVFGIDDDNNDMPYEITDDCELILGSTSKNEQIYLSKYDVDVNAMVKFLQSPKRFNGKYYKPLMELISEANEDTIVPCMKYSSELDDMLDIN